MICYKFLIISKHLTLTSKRVWQIIYIYIAHKVGPRKLPCGIPLVTLDLFEQDVPTFTHCNRLDKKQEIH